MKDESVVKENMRQTRVTLMSGSIICLTKQKGGVVNTRN